MKQRPAYNGTKLGPVRSLLNGKIIFVSALILALGSGLELSAQDALTATNEATGDLTANDSSQTGDATLADDSAETNSVAETNQTVAAGPDGRTRRLNWQRRTRSTRDNQKGTSTPTAGTNGAPNRLDYSTFRLVADRNIFDPNRAPRSSRPVQTKTVEAFTLVGTMSYEKGSFAFFDGTSSDYKKVLKPNGTIAGYKVLAIDPEFVKLSSSTTNLDLKVGTQMRRRDDGTWERSAEPAAYAAGSSSASQLDTAPSGAESDILKRMMQRREKE